MQKGLRRTRPPAHEPHPILPNPIQPPRETPRDSTCLSFQHPLPLPPAFSIRCDTAPIFIFTSSAYRNNVVGSVPRCRKALPCKSLVWKLTELGSLQICSCHGRRRPSKGHRILRYVSVSGSGSCSRSESTTSPRVPFGPSPNPLSLLAVGHGPGRRPRDPQTRGQSTRIDFHSLMEYWLLLQYWKRDAWSRCNIKLRPLGLGSQPGMESKAKVEFRVAKVPVS